jgi:sulfite exporter TauE/SafE
MPLPAYVSMLLLGLLGGIHCAGMCGGFVAALARGTPQKIHFGRVSVAVQALPCHLGRIAGYGLVAALLGALGASLGRASVLLEAETVFYTAANVFLVALGGFLLLRGSGVRALEGLGARIFAAIAPLARRLARGNGVSRRFALGMLWTLVPCGLLYAVFAVALLASDPLASAGLALAFGLGTLPNLLAAGWVLRLVQQRRWLPRKLGQITLGVVVAAFGVVGLLRAESLPQSLAWLCAVPH